MAERKWEVTGRSLAGLRAIHGMTQEQVAKIIEVHPTTLARIEQGRPPQFHQLLALAELYHVSLDALVSGSWADVPAMTGCTSRAASEAVA